MATASEQYGDYHLINGYERRRILDGMRTLDARHIRQGGERSSEAFTEAIEVSGTALAMLGFERSKPPTALLNETLLRAKARIDLGSFGVGQRYVKRIFSEDIGNPKPQVLDSEIRRAILASLLNIRRAHPERFKWMKLEVDGLCSLLEIEKSVYLFNAGVLKEKGWIAEWDYDQASLAAGEAYLTAEGVEALDCTERDTNEFHCERA